VSSLAAVSSLALSLAARSPWSGSSIVVTVAVDSSVAHDIPEPAPRRPSVVACIVAFTIEWTTPLDCPESRHTVRASHRSQRGSSTSNDDAGATRSHRSSHCHRSHHHHSRSK